MATESNRNEENLHSEFEKWLSRTGSESIYLLESQNLGEDKGICLTMLLASEYEFELHCIQDGSSGKENHYKASVSLSTLKPWAQSLNEFCQQKPHVEFHEVLTKAEELYKSDQAKTTSLNHMSVDESDEEKDEEAYKIHLSSEDEEGIFTTEWELQVARRKKRWLVKENQIRDGLKKAKVTPSPGHSARAKDPFTDPFKHHDIDPDTIFTGGGSSGVLTNDLLKIMEREKEVGFSAEPVEDNIYCWSVKFFDFGTSGELPKELHKLREKYGYDYIELQLDFTMDLYPFYPPMVKVIRPRLQGSLMQRVSHMENMKLSVWNPAKEMITLLSEVKVYLRSWARLDVECERNDRIKYKNGSYGNMDHYLLNLAFTSEINPRSNRKYLVEVDKTFSMSKVSKHKDKKKNEFWAAGVGFGHSRRPAWDMKAYLAAQREKDKKVETTLLDILVELRNLYSNHAPQLKPPMQGGEASMSNHVDSKHPPRIVDSKGEGIKHDLRNGEEEMEAELDTTPIDPIDNMYLVIEGSALIPFFEQYLKVDSFLEICRHTAVYKVIVDIIREFALQNQLIPLLGLLPQQEKSIFVLLENLAVKADRLLQHICKAGNGHVPKAAETEEEDSKSSGGWFSSQKKKSWFSKAKESTSSPAPGGSPANPQAPQQPHSTTAAASKGIEAPPSTPGAEETHSTPSSEEKLAREFQVLFRDVSEGFKRAKIDPRVLPPRDDSDEKPVYCTCVNAGINEDAVLEETYKKSLEPLHHSTSELPLTGVWAHHYAKEFNKQTGMSQAQVFRVAQEVSSLFTALPLSLRSSIFVCTDDDKMTLMKVLITGPEGTPYSGGCYVFDVFFPSTYPRSPPKVYLCTTGHNSVRFNPNLYSCGKVCLSLLGTWEGQSGEQWHETTSTVLQVLVSIQSLILVPDPYFNEPGYEREIGTEAGNKHSAEYNADVRVNNIKHAMLAQLTHPCPEFEDTIRMHFHIKQDRIIEELLTWQVPKQRKLDKLVVQLREAFKRNSTIVTKGSSQTDVSQPGSSASSCSETNDKLSGPSSSNSPHMAARESQPSTSQGAAATGNDSTSKMNNHTDDEPMDDTDSNSFTELICLKCGGIIKPAEEETGVADASHANASSSSAPVTQGVSVNKVGKAQANAQLTQSLGKRPEGDLLSGGHTVSEEDYPSDEEQDKVTPSALCFKY